MGLRDHLKSKVVRAQSATESTTPEDAPERAAELMRGILARAEHDFPDGFEVKTLGLVAEINDGWIYNSCSDPRKWIRIGLFRTASAMAENHFLKVPPPPSDSLPGDSEESS